MKRNKLKLRIVIFIIGFLGVLSMLTTEIPIPEEAEEIITTYLTPLQFKLISLLNPTLLLILAVWVGTSLYDKVNLKIPLIEWLLYKTEAPGISSIVKPGVWGGLICGALLTVITVIVSPHLPPEFLELGDKLQPGIASRLLYGGITEEILMRFGVMTFLVWLLYELLDKFTSAIYWIAIVVSAFIFGLGHFPILYSVIESPTTALLAFILAGNAIAGVVFGWLYWKKGLEAAMIAHMFAHVFMITGEYIFEI